MIAKAIEKIQALAIGGVEPRPFEIGNKKGIAIGENIIYNRPEIPESLHLTTLSGLVDYVNRGFDHLYQHGRTFVSVTSPTTVNLYSEAIPVYATRPNLVTVNAACPALFKFGQFMDGEEFMIAIQARFVQGVGDWDAVVSACAGIKKQDGIEYKDNGVAQTVAVQSGISLATTKKLPNPVELAPYRTFAEVEQPCSKFILRVTDGRNGPELGLFEADGGAWRLEAINNIKAWLDDKLSDITIIA